MKRLLLGYLLICLSFSSWSQPALVKNIDPVADGFKFSVGNVTQVNGTLYFGSADDGVNGQELWKSDGTKGGTSMVTNFALDPAIDDVFSANGILYFTATDATNGRELWKSDGTAAGTLLVKDIFPGTSSGATLIKKIVNIGSKIFFIANDGTNGYELWSSDGTSAGTSMVKDIAPGAGNGLAPQTQLLVVGTKVYFTANNGSNTGLELYVTDGTAANTTFLKDVNPNAGISGVVGSFTDFNNRLLFVGNDGVNGNEPWISDGTIAGTTMIKNIDGASNNSMLNSAPHFSGGFCVIGTSAYFGGQDGTVSGLWKTDGTSAGTMLVSSAGSNPGNIVNMNGTLYFTATNAGSGFELWKSDGTNAVLVKDINSGAASSLPEFFTYLPANGKVYFAATTTLTGTELWETDGTPAGTALVLDVNQVSVPPNANPVKLTVSGSNLFFIADDGHNGIELWKYTPTTPLPVPNTITDLTAVPFSNTSVKLNWTDSDTESIYEIEQSVGNNTSYSNVINLGADFNTTIASGLSQGITYFFRIRQKNASGYSSYSNELSITIPVVPPTVIFAELSSPTSISLNWNLIANVDGYFVQLSANNNTSYSLYVDSNNKFISNWKITGLTPGTTYYFRVATYEAFGASGGGKIYSVYSNEVSLVIPTSPPPVAPTGFNASITGSTVTLAWTDVSGESNYIVERSVNNTSSFVAIASPAANSITYSDTNINPDNTYYYRLAYVLGGQNSFYSHYSLYPYAISIPATPTNVTATVTGPNQITLAWNDVINEDSYIVKWGTTPIPGFIINPVSQNSINRVFNGLTVGTTYYFQVSAYNAAGQSGNSAIISATILQPTISVSGTVSAFSTTVGTPSVSKTFSVAGSNLAGNPITVTPPAPFEVSLSTTSGFGSSVDLIPIGGVVASTSVYVRYNPTIAGSHSGNVQVTATGAVTQNVAVSGTSTGSTVLVNAITVTGAGNATTISTVGGTLQMSSTVLPANATISTVTWSVTNGTGSATINTSGLLTATGNGTVTVKASANDASGISGTKVITISGQAPSILVTSIAASGADISTAGGTSQMSATVLPANATVTSVTWSVTNGTGSATINTSGLLTATGNGTVTVKASANDASGISGTKVIAISRQVACSIPTPTITSDFSTTSAPVLTSSAASGNQWYLNGESISGATSNTLVIPSDGIYTVQVAVSGCVSPFSADFVIIVTGIHELAHPLSIYGYPNPTNAYLTVTNVSEHVQCRVLNASGADQGIQYEVKNGQLLIYTDKLSPGEYVLQLYESAQFNALKFIKQ